MEILIAVLMSLLWVVLSLLGLVLLLLNLPYRALGEATFGDSRLDGTAYVGWPLRLFGVVVDASLDAQTASVYVLGLRVKQMPLSRFRKKKKLSKEKELDALMGEAKATKEKKRKRNGRARSVHMMKMPHKAAALKAIPKWLFMRGELAGRLGFDDPYTTWQVAMALSMVRTMLPSFGEDVVIDYLEPAFEGRMKVSFTVWIPRILIGAIRFLLSRQGRAMARHFLSRPKPASATV